MSTVNDIIAKTSQYVLHEFDLQGDVKLAFHNLSHTQDVVEAVQEIGQASGLSREDLEVVTIAAWLHDVGYLFIYKGHEERGAEIAQTFLTKEGYPQESIERVVNAILATRMPQDPKNLLEEVLCDADLSHLGRADSMVRSARLRKEWKDYFGENVSDLEWIKNNLTFMGGHRFHTEYARKELGPVVANHVAAMSEKLAIMESEQENRLQTNISDSRVEAEKEKKEKKKLKKLKKELARLQEEVVREIGDPEEKKQEVKTGGARLDRGIETVFRLTSRNHLNLSAMADSKANILISVNSIILSIVASLLLSKLDTHPWLVLPTIVLMCVCLSTIIASILATRPKVTSGTFTFEDILQKKVNLLFFGNFHGVTLKEYEQGFFAMMDDPDYLYGSLIKDIYFLGNVLGRKYRYLRVSYNIFMYGLILAVIAFVLAIVIGQPSTSTL